MTHVNVTNFAKLLTSQSDINKEIDLYIEETAHIAQPLLSLPMIFSNQRREIEKQLTDNQLEYRKITKSISVKINFL